MDILIALLTGLTAGLHTSTWGMYKDSPHEGFTWPKYFRSTIAGVLYGPIVWWITGLDLGTAAGVFLLWGSVYVAERATMEIWKTFLRTEDQSKYFIPMQLHVLGKVVESRRDRYIAAFFYVGGIALVGWGLVSLWGMYKDGSLNWNPYIILILLSVGGWVSAFGGAWKDAPIEGFEWFKFFRSPAVAYFWAWMAANLTDNFVVITLCSLGFTIACIETYKTFFFPSRPRGKFQGKPILFPDMLKHRQYAVPVFIACWIFVIVAGVLAFLGDHSGLV